MDETYYLQNELAEARRMIADLESVAAANRAEIMRLRDVVRGYREGKE